MSRSNTFQVNPGWQVLLLDLDLNPANVLRPAGLPEDILGRAKAALSKDEYFHYCLGKDENRSRNPVNGSPTLRRVWINILLK